MSKKEESAQEQPTSPSILPVKSGNDLENIRDILFGNQARATETRLGELETRAEAMRQDLLNEINVQTSSVNDRLSKKIGDGRKEFDSRLQRLDEQQTTLVNNTRDALSTQQSQQTKKLSAEIEQNRQALSDEVERITADFQQQISETRKTLQDGLNRLQTELSERLLSLQSDMHRRDNDLRQELLTMTAWLDDKKATRLDLGEMLIEMGQQLQNNNQPEAADLDSE